MLALLTLLALSSVCCAQVGLPVEFDKGPGWEPRPAFLGNAADVPGIVPADGVVTLTVDEPGRGMKFELPLRPFNSEAVTYLILRYRALNLGGGYAIWMYDGSQGGLQVVGTDELQQDGRWHVLAVDLAGRGVAGGVRSVLTEVQCAGEPASVSFDYIRVSDEVPEGATVMGGEALDAKEYVLRPADLVREPQPDWLSLDADRHSATDEDGVLHLQAEGPGKGMKWSLDIEDPIDLGQFRYVAVRYKAENVEPWGDYFVWLGSEGGGMPQESVTVMPLSQVRGDGTWTVMVGQLREEFTAVNLALQVSSSGARGDAWIDTIRFTTRRPLIDVSDLLPFEEGWGSSDLPEENFKALDMSAAANARVQSGLRALGLSEWLPGGKVTSRGIPFELSDAEYNVLKTPMDIDQTVGVDVGARAKELYLLLGANLPTVDLARMGDPLPMRVFSNPERFVVRVAYEDGVTDEMFPISVGTGRYEVRSGPEVYCLTGLRDVAIKRVELRNRMDTGSFVLAGITLNQGEAIAEAPHVTGLPAPTARREETPGAPTIEARGDGICRLTNGLMAMTLQVGEGLALWGIENRCLQGETMTVQPGPLFELGNGETTVTSEEVLVSVASVETRTDSAQLVLTVDATAKDIPLKGTLTFELRPGGDILMDLDLVHVGEGVLMPVVNFPLINGVRIGPAEDTWYLWGRKGGIINNLPTTQRQAYGGEYPIQVADVFSPGAGGGLALLTYDTEDVYRFWDLRKDDEGVHWRMDYWQREYQPGERIETVPTALRAHTGDWRRALELYRTWAHSWYKPQVPRKDWFQGVFYYQQSTAWGPLRNQQTGQWRMEEIIDEYRDYFGCLDYLHIFDFGQSRVYGRVGDYSHYDELGGLAAMREAIKQAQDMGVRVGLYIEGYLCDERSVWGQENVSRCDIRKKDGAPLLWGGDSPEHMMCPASDGWRDHLAETYRRVAGELKPDGMYIDQYGFINTWKTCWSREHGHPVPWAPIRGERDTTEAIRASTPATIATLTEETPNDVNSQYQDGALGYSVTWSQQHLMPHRVDLFRFLFPDFKVLQLVQYNAYTEGGWQLLKYPFFNGEAYWLHGGTTTTYCEDAHQFLRKAFAILNENEDAFCSGDVEPLMPTLKPTVYANRFSGAKTTAWTLLNAQYRTFRGDCLRVKHVPGTRYVDAFSGDGIAVVVDDGYATIPVELGPRAVGCILARHQ